MDLILIAFALACLVGVARRSPRARPVTVVVLSLLTAGWVWANLRDRGWEQEWNEAPPEGLDPFTQAFFYRGWPLSPFMFCPIRSMSFRPMGIEWIVLVLDGLILLVTLSALNWVCRRTIANPARTAIEPTLDQVGSNDVQAGVQINA